MDEATEPPLKLNSVAREFWDRHYGRLRDVGLLTDADVDTFAVLCLVWSKLSALAATEPGEEQFREMVQLDRLTKQFHSLGREFGLCPKDRKRSKLDGEKPRKKDEFEL
ncbi:P27 family phage terminase small subunit [bacterium]|nr:P27 family phage terminase small subunit [bacterium]